MESDFPEVLSRDFALGYFLPAALFVAASAFVFYQFQALPSLLPLPSVVGVLQLPLAFSGAIIASWFLGVLLLATNRALIRFLAGYGILQHTPLLRLQRHRFQALRARIRNLENELFPEGQAKKAASPQTKLARDRLLFELRTRYPRRYEYVLPTAFGNAIRSFELYSYDVYGMDSIPLWPRLLAVLPADFRKTLDGAKARVDYSVNMMYLSLVIVLEYLVLAGLTWTNPTAWIMVVALLLAFLHYQMAISNAIAWGNFVKAGFDLFRDALLFQIGIRKPATWEEEQVVWQNISQSFLYWDRLDLPRATIESDRYGTPHEKRNDRAASESDLM